MNNIKVIIVAGGKGSRLPDSERETAKCLVEVAGEPILKHQIRQLKNQGFNDICISLGYKAEQVIDWLKVNNYDDIRYVVEDKPLGTGGGIKLAIQDWQKPFIVLFGDIIADFNFRDIVSASRDGEYSVVTGFHINDVTGMGVLDYREDKKVLAYKEKIYKGIPGFINANASFLYPRDFLDMPDEFSTEYDFFPKIIFQKKLMLYKHPGHWFDCGTEDRLEKARRFFRVGTSDKIR